MVLHIPQYHNSICSGYQTYNNNFAYTKLIAVSDNIVFKLIMRGIFFIDL